MGDFQGNTQYLYQHLPSRYRTADAEQDYFLLRFLSVFGQKLDHFDNLYDSLPSLVSPYSAPDEWVNYLLKALFGWSFFPEWFTDEDRLYFFQEIAQLYAKRGTPEGIEEFLLRFGIKAHVITQSPAIGELTIGEDEWLMPGPLGIIVQIELEAGAAAEDMDVIGEFAVGESHLAIPSHSVDRVDLDQLLRFMQPLAQVVMIEDLRGPSL